MMIEIILLSRFLLFAFLKFQVTYIHVSSIQLKRKYLGYPIILFIIFIIIWFAKSIFRTKIVIDVVSFAQQLKLFNVHRFTIISDLQMFIVIIFQTCNDPIYVHCKF